MQTRQDRRGIGEAAVREPCALVRSPLQADAATCQAPLNVGLLTGGQDRHYAVGLGNGIDGAGFGSRGHRKRRNRRPRVPRKSACAVSQSARWPAGRESRCEESAEFLSSTRDCFDMPRPQSRGYFTSSGITNSRFSTERYLCCFISWSGKKVVFTAHNVNAGRRDKKDSWLNRITLKCQYKLADHVFVHTKKMKNELVGEFDVEAEKVTVIPYGINNAVPFY